MGHKPLFFTFFLIILFSLPVSAQNTYKTDIPIQKNEHWWGLFVGNSSVRQPFASDFTVSTHCFIENVYVTSAMVSDNGRYIWSDYPMRVTFTKEKITIESDYEKVEVKKGGKTLREASLVCNLKNIKPEGSVLPSKELFTRPVYDLRIEAGPVVTQDMVIGYADRIIAAGFPTGIILLPESWESLSRMHEFDYDLYPSPEQMVSDLHSKGFKVMVTVTPYIPAVGLNYINAVNRNQIIKNDIGNPVIFRTGFGYNVCLDLTDPEWAERYNDSLDRLKSRFGIDGFRLECYHILPYIGTRNELFTAFMNNWNRIGEKHDMVIYSSAYGGVSTTYVNSMWGDETLSWSNLSEAMYALPLLGLTGYTYSNFALGAIKPDTDENQILSAIQIALAMPVAILPPTLDCFSDPEYSASVRRALQARMDMASYMETLTYGTGKTTAPVIRHMEYQYPNSGFFNCEDQFMIGSRYLVAPIVSDSGTRTVRLPKGTWVSNTGTVFKGPRVISIDSGNSRMAWFELQGK